MITGIAFRDREWKRTKSRLASIWLPMGRKKQRTIKCWRRAGKNSSRRAELLDPSRGRSKKSNSDRATALARELFAGQGFALAFSRGPELHCAAGRKSGARRLR